MRSFLLIAALALAGCASTYQLTVMPRDSGKLYSGIAEDNGNGEGRISITIDDKNYSGTWVETQPTTTTGFVTGFGFGRRGGMGSFVTMDNPQGGESKALLTAPDGSGLRCDFKSGAGRGGGACHDDKGRGYDVQVRRTERK
jgi:hypothetical protein